MQIKGKFESKRGEDHLVSHFRELIRVEEERRREEEEEEEKKKRKKRRRRAKGMELVWKL